METETSSIEPIPDAETGYSTISYEPTPNDPPWTSWPAIGVFVLSVLAIVIFPVFLIVPFFAIKGVEPPQDLAADPTVILLGLAAIIPAHLFTLLVARPIVTGRGKYPFFATLGWKLGNFRWWYFPVVVAGFFGIAMLVTSVFPEQDNDIIRILRSSPYAAYALAALATIFAPLVEEVVYRGVLYSAFQRSIGAPLAVTVVTLLFAGIHYAQYWGSPGTIILITLLSLILTLTRAISGNLLPCVILHFLFNGLQSVGIIATMTDTNAEAAFFHFLK